MKRAIVCAGLVLLAARPVSAQPTTLAITPGSVVAGGTASATITGPPGHFYALAGSSVGAGASYGGVNLALGSDAALIVIGILDGSGMAVVPVTPPFLGSVLDRAYYQVGTSLVSAGAGSVLAVRNVSAGVITLTPSAGGPQGVSAHLVIKRLLP